MGLHILLVNLFLNADTQLPANLIFVNKNMLTNDELVKSQKAPVIVIPVKTGIH